MKVYSLTKLIGEKRENKKDGVSEKYIGIDIGTDNCYVAVMKDERPVIVPNSEGEKSTPTFIAFSKDGKRLIGTAAKRQAITNPKRTIHSIIKDMGSEKTYYIDGMEYKPYNFYQMLLEQLKADAEAYLGENVYKTVIAVPGSFDGIQRKAVRHAATLAGFTKIRIVNESSAAAMMYGFFVKEEERAIIYNLGAGYFDVSLIEVGGGVVEVLEINGQSNLGGNDFDDRIVRWILDEYKKSEGIDLASDKMALQRIREAAESAKKSLSTMPSINISLPFIGATMEGPKHLSMHLTREKFEELTKDLIEKAKSILENMMKSMDGYRFQPKHVFLTGGATHIPAVQEMIKDVTKLGVRKSSNPEESVAIGAALVGGHLAGECGRVAELLLLEVLTHSLCIETMGGVATRLIEKNTAIPTCISQVFSTAADNQTAIDINILQGEQKLAKDNKTLGTLRLDGISPAPKGVPQLEVRFDIDSNGIIAVEAKDLATGKSVNTRVGI